MAKAPTREAEADMSRPPPEPTPFEKMTELTRRIIHVPKSEVVKPKRKGKTRDA